ncbi:MAG: lipocalin-like domain-containing protein [Alphaproteobacteria bacterium]
MVTADQLVGTWELVRWETSYEDGRKIYPMGEDAQGFILYTPDGFMSAVLFRANRPPFTTGEALTAKDTEKVAGWDGYYAYGGPFEIQGDRVVHTVAHCIYPNWVGDTQVRGISFEDDNLVLSTPPQKTRRGTQTSRVIWKRANRAYTGPRP